MSPNMLLLFCLMATLTGAVITAKLTQLRILAFLPPATVNEEQTDNICQAAMQVAVDAANNNPDFLQDFHVVPDYRPEGILGTRAPVELMKFLGQSNHDPRVFLSPAIVGLYYICQTISGIVREMNMVQFATWCAGTIFTGNRKRFPNLYRHVTPQEGFFPIQMYLIKVMAKWKRVGLVYYPGNISEFLVAKLFYQVLESNGVTIAWFASAINFDSELIESMNESNVRVVFLGFYEAPRLFEFICLAYRENTRAPRYIFVAYANAFLDPKSHDFPVPKGCTKDQIYEQFKGILWVGNMEAISSIGMNRNTSLGYDIPEFERRMLGGLTGPGGVDMSRRYHCHDAMLHTLVALNDVDKKLGLKSGLEQPAVLMDALNKSAAFIPYEGVQHRMLYSDRLEKDSRFQVVGQWRTDLKRLQVITRIWYTGNSSSTLSNLSFYQVQLVDKPVWPTKSGEPTEDLSTVRHFEGGNVAPWIFWIGLSVACALTVIHFKFMIIFVRSNEILGISDQSTVNILCFLGAIVLNVASVAFLWEKTTTSCSASVIITTIGAWMLNMGLFGKLTLASRFVKLSKKRVNAPTRRETITVLHNQINRNFILRVEEFVFLIVNVIIIIVWFVTPDQRIQKSTEISRVLFDDVKEFYYDVAIDSCYSPTKMYWVIALCVVNGIPILASAFFAYNVRHAVIPQFLRLELKSLQITAINAMAIFLLVILVNILFPGSAENAEVWAFGLLIYANSTGFAAVVPMLYHKIIGRPFEFAPAAVESNRSRIRPTA